jgi:hypothetical protein
MRPVPGGELSPLDRGVAGILVNHAIVAGGALRPASAPLDSHWIACAPDTPAGCRERPRGRPAAPENVTAQAAVRGPREQPGVACASSQAG